MENEILSLYPQRVFYYFVQISKIPRGSGNEKAISDYLVNFAKSHGLYVHQDEWNNVLIKKEASKGYEKYQAIALQGHMDMVCEKNSNVEFDFTKDPLKLMIKDGFLKANGTTLGADNGISLAMTLAILEANDIKHPKLEVMLTTDEEVGMQGAKNFDVSLLEAKSIVNIDSEEYGIIYVSSAGASTVRLSLDLEKEKLDSADNTYLVKISGLKGGHSGCDIHENRANATKLLADLLRRLKALVDFEVSDFKAGNKNNTIPREAEAKICTKAKYEDLVESLNFLISAVRFQYKDYEECIELEVSGTNLAKDKLSKCSTNKMLDFIASYPNGVIKLSEEIDNLVETSLNLGITKMLGDKLQTECLIRSAKELEQKKMVDFMEKYAKLYKADFVMLDFYKPWEYKKDSKIRDFFAAEFEKQTGKKAPIMALHAGLECGAFAERNPELDIISVGPDIKNPHTPDERMSIEAVKNTWEYLIKCLEACKID